jgi:multidrug efflux pump subunit AcrB
VIDVWMPQGSRFEATDAVMRRIEGELMHDRQVDHLASFVGQSSPRFYYNVNPQQPDPAYGQFIVNPKDVKATTALVMNLRTRLARLAPEAMVLVQELQQGAVMEAPVEFRLSGDDPERLKAIGEQVGDILRADRRASFIHTDYRNDAPMMDVSLNTSLGDRAVDIVLRADPDHRASFDAVRNTYVDALVSGSKAPLRAVADLQPTWQTSRLVRRNGVPTLTMRCLPRPGTYASAILKDALPKVQALAMPAGYHLEIGGEQANQGETQPEMVGALENSAGVRIARAKVAEVQAKRRIARADFLPRLDADASLLHSTDAQLVKVPAGSLGTVPGLGPFPTRDAALDQGKRTLGVENLTLAQPLTQLALDLEHAGLDHLLGKP